MKLALSVLSMTLLFSWHAVATPLSGIDPANFDPAVRKQDNFYEAINGTWIKHTVIPADKAAIGTFTVLHDRSQEQIRTLIEEAARAPDTAEAEKIGALYTSFMNENVLEKQGLNPIKGQLDVIRHIKTQNDLMRYLGQQQAQPVGGPIGLYVAQDAKEATRYLVHLTQTGLGLPDRDYYLKPDARFDTLRQAYVAHLERLFALERRYLHAAKRRSNTPQRAAAVFALERELATLQWSNVENRDPQKTYNLYTLNQLQQLTPTLNWHVFFDNAGLPATQTLNINQPSYFSGLATLMQTVPLATWRDYLTLMTLSAYAPYLNKAMDTAHFDFYGRVLSGTTEMRPRWKRAVSLVDSSLGEAVGKRYVAQYFSPEAKKRMEQLVRNLMQAYAQSIDQLSWMSVATRQAAQEKLRKYHCKIGYPNTWKTYSALNIHTHDLVGNINRVAQFQYNRMIEKLGKPIDRDEWAMTPQTVNAYYSPTLNEIVFPAAILQPPFFDMAADDAVNYGAIGTVIGHEISHGFDDMGSQYDGDGNLKNWWTDEDKARFDALTAQLVTQYAAYEVLPGKYLNGELTLGENIADNAGLQIAYKAYRLALKGQEPPERDGFTGDQRFFIGFAQIWRNKAREEERLRRLLTDPHSPGEFRTLGSVTNHDAFYRAFDVKPGDKLFKPEEKRIRLW